MTNMAVYMRMTGLQVGNDDVDSRKKASTALATKWSKVAEVDAIARKVSEIVLALSGDGVAPEFLALEIEAAVQEHASAFLHVDRPLEVGICAGVAVMEILDAAESPDGWTSADAFGAMLWSALGFIPTLADPKREALRLDVLNRAQQRTVEAALKSRERSQVKDFGDFSVAAGEEAKSSAAFKKATLTTITALRRNAALDREELDFLWWSLLGRSRLLKRSLHEIGEAVRLVAQGIEAGNVLRRLPCDVHADLVLRTLDKDLPLNLAELVQQMGDDRNKLSEAFSETFPLAHPVVFPLLNSLITAEVTVVGAEGKRPSSDWGTRALLEAALVQIMTNGPAKL